MSDRKNRRSVEHVVAAGVALDLDGVLGAILKADDKVALDALDVRMHADDVMVSSKPYENTRRPVDLASSIRMGVVAKDDDRAALAHQTHKLGEGGLDLLDARVVIEMVGLDVGHDDHIGVKEQEGAIGLIRLGDKIVAGAVPAVGVVTLDNATDQKAGSDQGGRAW